ncbi:hypothetical protein, partial [Lactococcus lactis]|uniref:hypothetical protein n=1 Tax=Lactococcus lactis TaxID=1358 RepID=UPI0022E83696
MTQETAKERIYREALEEVSRVLAVNSKLDLVIAEALIKAKYLSDITTDKLSVDKLQEELESCIQTLIEASVAANITQDIVVGNLVDRKLADLAKTHKLAV